jgi:CBS domain-containing protein
VARLRNGLPARTVRDLARRPAVVCTGGESLTEVAAQMRREGVSAIAVERLGRLEGIITERDLVRAIERGLPARDTSVSACMTRAPMTVRPGDSLLAAAQLMFAMQVRHLLVVEEDRLIGCLSARDLLG